MEQKTSQREIDVLSLLLGIAFSFSIIALVSASAVVAITQSDMQLTHTFMSTTKASCDTNNQRLTVLESKVKELEN